MKSRSPEPREPSGTRSPMTCATCILGLPTASRFSGMSPLAYRLLNRRTCMASLAVLYGVPGLAPADSSAQRARPRIDRGAIVRGPRDHKRLALVFTGDQYAEGAGPILKALHHRRVPAAWFLTGRFLRDPDFRPII